MPRLSPGARAADAVDEESGRHPRRGARVPCSTRLLSWSGRPCDVIELPTAVEHRLERCVQPEHGEETRAWNRLDPVARQVCRRGGSQVEIDGAVGVLLQRGETRELGALLVSVDHAA